ncbi:nucleolar GTP-binding-like protein, putative [Medicago truncatula]|uniref:Nucleolar GTP-binding-like protein, putative n=1 Tax=Medicago truncatula TaxID=3880 RepID=A0A072VKS4_MEDTR|nr:nucleolar GTP-binding-like protein, putative [Medicago truncatula]
MSKKKKLRNSKKNVRKVNVSGKPKHSLDVNRSNVATKKSRSAATVRRLKMYKSKPVHNHNRKGKA